MWSSGDSRDPLRSSCSDIASSCSSSLALCPDPRAHPLERPRSPAAGGGAGARLEAASAPGPRPGPAPGACGAHTAPGDEPTPAQGGGGAVPHRGCRAAPAMRPTVADSERARDACIGDTLPGCAHAAGPPGGAGAASTVQGDLLEGATGECSLLGAASLGIPQDSGREDGVWSAGPAHAQWLPGAPGGACWTKQRLHVSTPTLCAPRRITTHREAATTASSQWLLQSRVFRC